ncbi:MAG: hypothetical protein HOW73_07745 [Polyangiaceae bacterium]|nr:hypothetical protein [Polyangiaceae bacterium]
MTQDVGSLGTPDAADVDAPIEAAPVPIEAVPPKEATAEPKLYRELDFKGRMARAAITAFTLYHLVAMLVGGGTKEIKRPFQYVMGFYDEGLRMTNSWGMFGKPPGATHVVVEGVKPDGTTIQLATTRAADRTFIERIRDVRMRKIQGKLTDLQDRTRWGGPYLDYFCRDAKAKGLELKSVRIINQIHELKDDAGKVKRKPSTVTLTTRTCGQGGPGVTLPPVRREPAVPKSSSDGDDNL